MTNLIGRETLCAQDVLLAMNSTVVLETIPD